MTQLALRRQGLQQHRTTTPPAMARGPQIVHLVLVLLLCLLESQSGKLLLGGHGDDPRPRWRRGRPSLKKSGVAAHSSAPSHSSARTSGVRWPQAPMAICRCCLAPRMTCRSAVLSSSWQVLWAPLGAVVACSHLCSQGASAAASGATPRRHRLAARRAASGAQGSGGSAEPVAAMAVGGARGSEPYSRAWRDEHGHEHMQWYGACGECGRAHTPVWDVGRDPARRLWVCEECRVSRLVWA